MMKHFLCLLGACSVVVSLYAQPDALGITTNKTTSLIFPYTIKHVDRGSRDVLVQPISEAGNVLLVKAGTIHFPETNLSVITADGTVYSFAVHYDAAPVSLVYRLLPQSGPSIELVAIRLVDNPAVLHHRHRQNGLMDVSLLGIYSSDSVLYCQLQLTNHSPIDYKLAYQQFFIRDKARHKRTASQELEVHPILIANQARQVKAKFQVTEVIALPRLTLPEHTRLVMEIGEQNGGRRLQLLLKNHLLLGARPVANFQGADGQH